MNKKKKKWVRVCKDWYKAEDYKRRRKDGFPMDAQLKRQLDIAIKNVVKDWDFTIIISGGGEVRVGKSLLGIQIMAYWAYRMEKEHGIKVPFSIKNNLVFQWQNLITHGHDLGKKHKYCPLQYDEAGETMEGRKSMTKSLRQVRDYLRECGQYNFLNILVLPEFFDLPKGIAITRSTFLIDVSYTANKEGYFQRGHFKFYSRKKKKKLYLEGKKKLNYNAVPYNFKGNFTEFYPIDEEEYRKKKHDAFATRSNISYTKALMFRDFLFWYIHEDQELLSQKEIVELIKKKIGFSMGASNVSRSIKKIKKQFKDGS